MSGVFVDTSAILALLNPLDEHHAKARKAFDALRAAEARLVTTSFVLVETHALLERRFGLEVVARFRESFTPLLDVVWIARDLYEPGLDLLLERRHRGLSLVDAVSFTCMRRERVDRAFAFDRHFTDEGFERV